MAQATGEPTPTHRPPAGSAVTGVALLGAAVAVLVAAGFTALSGARPLTSLGLPDPGTLTTVGLPAVRRAGRGAHGAGHRGGAARRVPGAAAGLRVARRRRLSGGAGRVLGAAGWAAAAVLMVPLSVADALGPAGRRRARPGLLLELDPTLDRRHRVVADGDAGVRRARRLPHVLTWGWTAVLFGASAARPAAGGADRALRGRRRARPGHRQPDAARARRRGCGSAGWSRCS